MFNHILLPTDGSDLSLRAIDTGMALARRLGAKVYVLHVGTPFPAAAVFLPELAQTSEVTYITEVAAAAERFLAQGRERAHAAGLACTTAFEFGPHPYRVIVDTATQHRCDLIVMASHGWRGIDRLVMGSETHRVILHTTIPVLVCR